MSGSRPVHDPLRSELLREAVARQTPVALSCRVCDGWAGFYSKFLQHAGDNELLLEYPWCDGSYIPELVTGQILGISFRRGPKRCVFSSSLVATRRVGVNGSEIPAILIAWPAEVFELQRRLDYRAPVPAGKRIIVSAQRQLQPAQAPDSAVQADLIDLSAGGMSLRFSHEDYPQWNYNDVIHCTFTAGPDEPPFELTTRVRYAQQARDSLRIGLQWFGLEATEQGRQVLDRIIDLCAEYQQIEIQRVGAADVHT
jgi:c-di-GMP-binding flagellar brake protein YcgR